MMVPAELGADWVRGSLAEGSGLAMLMTTRLSQLELARLLIPELPRNVSVPPPAADGRGISMSHADKIAERFFNALAGVGVRTLVVEDDVARRGDPGIGGDAVFLGDRVIRWADLVAGARAAVRLLRTGASGYPLNAFACWHAPGDLGLKPGRTLDESLQSAVVDSTCAVITSVYDAEAFLVLMSRDLDQLVRIFGFDEDG